jgi:2-polyprenyl-3-methyl-5-hydroxy-6-metoxy-1,4-benzoquinol methylase
LLDDTASIALLVNLAQGTVENSDLGKVLFDFVASSQVINHLYNPAAVLENVRDHLKLGDIFLVSTPNLSVLGARWMKEKWHGYCDNNISLMGKRECDEIIKPHGFESLYTRNTFFSHVPVIN